MPSYNLVGLRATGDSIHLFATVLDQDPTERPPAVTVVFEGRPLPVAWRRQPIGSPGDRLWWAKLEVSDLKAAAYYRAELVDAGLDVKASARVATLPADGSTPFQLVVGSCFDILGQHRNVLDDAYRVLSQEAPVDLSYNMWLGDQVYVDAPWSTSTRATDARRTIYDRYLRSWGLRTPSGLANAMSQSSNWYLPDDHEFWNGYPDPSWLTLFWHTFKRFVRQVWRALPPSKTLPHPASQGEWGKTAGEAYCVFASDLDFDTFDESVSPEGLQQVDFGGVVLVAVDTRWRRTIRKALDGAGFMLEDDLDALVALLDNEPRTVCLALSRPIIGFLPRQSVSPGPADGGPEQFPHQYTRLWKALARRARKGWPTLTVAGDVHRHAVRGALGGGLLEVVSSPTSLLDALDDRSWVTRMRNAADRFRVTVRNLELKLRRRKAATIDFAYPDFGFNINDDDQWDGTAKAGTEFFLAGARRSGLAGVQFDTSDPARPVVTVRSVVEPQKLPGDLVVATRQFSWRAGDGWVETSPGQPPA
ncbi:MAG: hypothetical protein KAZ88_01625 [Acidimicrobiia bacterium]|nr:hypothetical protein [Acidimicrobiia bacterium]MBP8179673.1 hypothetical protein [Acidimicrobiia bacterium]